LILVVIFISILTITDNNNFVAVRQNEAKQQVAIKKLKRKHDD